MSRFKILFVLLSLFAFKAEAQAPFFSSKSQISLITCSPGSELYSVFGHSAIRVHDTTSNTDLIFNYGVFDFNTPHFYWKFIRGKLRYQLAIQRTDDFVRAYAMEGRSVKEEKLQLTQSEKRRVIYFLRKNYRPENRYYLYDFFYNNCSTKIWDVADEQIPAELVFDTSVYTRQSFREMLEPYLEKAPWSKLGIDLLLGIPADKIATFEQQMYLPDYLSRNMSHTLREEAIGGKEKLLGPEQVILERDPRRSGLKKPFFTPLLVFGLVLVVSVGITIWGSRGTKRWLDVFLAGLPALLGVVLLFMWFGTNHQQMDGNLNLLWANPLGLIFIYFLLRKSPRLAGWWAGVLLVFLVINLAGWTFLPQQFNLALLPLVFALAIRGADHFLAVCCPLRRITPLSGVK